MNYWMFSALLARPGPQRVKPRAHNASRPATSAAPGGTGPAAGTGIGIGIVIGIGTGIRIRTGIEASSAAQGRGASPSPRLPGPGLAVPGPPVPAAQPSPALRWRRSGPAPAVSPQDGAEGGRAAGARLAWRAGGITLPASSALSALFSCLESRGRRARRNPAMF